MYAGIDYGFGQSNIDSDTGIRYGVISCHSLADWLYDAQEFDYGAATCPKCGNPAADYDPIAHEALDSYSKHGCSGYACVDCAHTLDSQDCFPEEPAGWSIDDGEYKVIGCLDSDAMVLKAPYFTRAAFCSPCVPGACSIETPNPDGARAYSFGHDWFEGGKAPYPVYSVETGAEVFPEVQS